MGFLDSCLTDKVGGTFQKEGTASTTSNIMAYLGNLLGKETYKKE